MTDIARNSRQTFLGADAPKRIDDTHVAVLGLGGGGSHIVQQLAHVGFRRLTICDPDVVEDTNLNRLIGATLADVIAKVGSSRVDLQACKLEYSIVSPK